jgi:hypothetical protein
MTAALFAFSSDHSRLGSGQLSCRLAHERTAFWSPVLSPLLSILHDLAQWVSNGFGATPSKANHSAGATNLVAARACQTGISGTNASKIPFKNPILKTPALRVAKRAVQPLRVVRVVEAGQAAASSGRMLISGRMADVCAELDRLAAREALLH